MKGGSRGHISKNLGDISSDDRTTKSLSDRFEPGKPLFKNNSINKAIENGGGSKYSGYTWLTTEEAASYLRISPAHLRNLTSNGKVPRSKLGSSNRYLKDDLDRLLLSTRQGGQPWE